MVEFYTKLFDALLNEHIDFEEECSVSPDENIIDNIINYSKSTEVVQIGDKRVIVSLN